MERHRVAYEELSPTRNFTSKTGHGRSTMAGSAAAEQAVIAAEQAVTAAE
jgi:hypothetical protein